MTHHLNSIRAYELVLQDQNNYLLIPKYYCYHIITNTTDYSKKLKSLIGNYTTNY